MVLILLFDDELHSIFATCWLNYCYYTKSVFEAANKKWWSHLKHVSSTVCFTYFKWFPSEKLDIFAAN